MEEADCSVADAFQDDELRRGVSGLYRQIRIGHDMCGMTVLVGKLQGRGLFGWKKLSDNLG